MASGFAGFLRWVRVALLAVGVRARRAALGVRGVAHALKVPFETVNVLKGTFEA